MFKQVAIAVVLTTGIFLAAGALAAEKTPCPAAPRQPIRLHPDNPHYLLWRGKPTVLVTSSEHYGAVMNGAFDYIAYLDELQSVGLNLTRIFSGVYCESQGDLDIKDNTLAPGHGKLLCPFARSHTPGYANGGNKFDLTRWDEAYFTRLKGFVDQAGKRGIVVEFSFLCPYYGESQWSLSPFNVKNNVNGADMPQIDLKNSLTHPRLFEVQQALVRKVVTELKDADNLYYEICNEAYGAYGVPVSWQKKIANTIVEAEKDVSCKHLIAKIASLFTRLFIRPCRSSTFIREQSMCRCGRITGSTN